jgi:hypothetical protein
MVFVQGMQLCLFVSDDVLGNFERRYQLGVQVMATHWWLRRSLEFLG